MRGVRGVLKMMGLREGVEVLETFVRREVRRVVRGGMLANQMLRSDAL